MLLVFHVLGKKKKLCKSQPHCNEIAMLSFGLWLCVSANIHCQLNPAMRDCLRNTKFRSKRQETLMVPMLLWQGCSLQPALCFAWASPHAGKSLSTQTWAETESCQLASKLEMCHSDIREDLCDEVIIIFILLLSPLGRYVTFCKSNKLQSMLNRSACTPLIPAWWKPSCSLEFTHVPVQWGSEDNMKTEILERLAPGQLCRGLAQRYHHSCKVLGV